MSELDINVAIVMRYLALIILSLLPADAESGSKPSILDCWIGGQIPFNKYSAAVNAEQMQRLSPILQYCQYNNEDTLHVDLYFPSQGPSRDGLYCDRMGNIRAYLAAASGNRVRVTGYDVEVAVNDIIAGCEDIDFVEWGLKDKVYGSYHTRSLGIKSLKYFGQAKRLWLLDCGCANSSD